MQNSREIKNKNENIKIEAKNLLTNIKILLFIDWEKKNFFE